MTNSDYITLTEADNLTGIPKESIKRYMHAHDDFINYKKDGRVYYISVESIEALKQIRQYYNAGFRKERVSELLQNEGHPVTITFNDENEAGKSIANVNEEVQEMKEMLFQQMQVNQKLVQEVTSLKEYIRQDMKKEIQQEIRQEANARDKKVMEKMDKHLQETKEARKEKEEIASALEEEKNKGFWQKLFGK